MAAAVAGACAVTAACGWGADGEAGHPGPVMATVAPTTTTTTTVPPPASPASTVPVPPPTTAASTTVPAPTTTTTATPGVVEVRYRIERRVSDEATAGFEEFVEATLSDPRGWSRAGFRLVRADDGPFLVVLADGPEVDRLCLPHDTYGEYSCQRSEVVALNAERWREATPKWTGDLVTYRRMLVNHEVGHLLGQPHPRVQCPRVGRPAPLMAQQSTELDGCLPNPWPLDDEVVAAARHDRPLAPL